MNLKKYVLAVLAAALSMGAFAYPAPQEEEPVTDLLQRYTAQMQQLQKTFEKELLPPVKATAQLALKVQASNQTELTPEQENLFDQYTKQLDGVLSKLVAHALKEVDMAQLNEQYKQMAKTYNFPFQQLTLQDVANLMKGMYLMSAISYFEQSKKLSQDEVVVLAELFFPQEEEDEEDQ